MELTALSGSQGIDAAGILDRDQSLRPSLRTDAASFNFATEPDGVPLVFLRVHIPGDTGNV